MLIYAEICYLEHGKIKQNKFMKKPIIRLIILIFVLSLVYYFFFKNGKNFDKTEMDHKVDSLNAQIKLREDSIKLKESEIKGFEVGVKRSQVAIDNNNDKIDELYDKFNVQVRTVDSYDVVQLEYFFTDRYKDSASIKY